MDTVQGSVSTHDDDDRRRRLVVILGGFSNTVLEEEELAPLGDGVEVRQYVEEKDARHTREVVQDADAVIVKLWKLDHDAIAAMERCQVIVRYGVGYDNVNVEAAKVGLSKCTWVGGRSTARGCDTLVSNHLGWNKVKAFSCLLYTSPSPRDRG